jgi:hypothetical protein
LITTQRHWKSGKNWTQRDLSNCRARAYFLGQKQQTNVGEGVGACV